MSIKNEDVVRNTRFAAKKITEKFGCTTVLKSHKTVVCSTKKEIYSFNSKKYNFDIPIFLDNNFFLDRKINGSKIEKLGFKYKYNDVFSF